MEKYYRIEMSETRWQPLFWVSYIAGILILNWGSWGWKFWIYMIIIAISMVLVSIKLKVIKRRA